MAERIVFEIDAILNSGIKSKFKNIFSGIKPPNDLLGVKKSVQELKSGLMSFKMPDKLATTFSGQFSAIEKEIDKYEALMAKPMKTKADLSNLEKSGQKINSLFKEVAKTIQQTDSQDISIKVDDKQLKAAQKELETYKNTIKEKERTIINKASQLKRCLFDIVL